MSAEQCCHHHGRRRQPTIRTRRIRHDEIRVTWPLHCCCMILISWLGCCCLSSCHVAAWQSSGTSTSARRRSSSTSSSSSSSSSSSLVVTTTTTTHRHAVGSSLMLLFAPTTVATTNTRTPLQQPLFLSNQDISHQESNWSKASFNNDNNQKDVVSITNRDVSPLSLDSDHQDKLSPPHSSSSSSSSHINNDKTILSNHHHHHSLPRYNNALWMTAENATQVLYQAWQQQHQQQPSFATNTTIAAATTTTTMAPPSLVETIATIVAVRGFGKSFCFVDLELPQRDDQKSSTTNQEPPPPVIVQAMLKRQDYHYHHPDNHGNDNHNENHGNDDNEMNHDDDNGISIVDKNIPNLPNTFEGVRKIMLPDVTIRIVGSVATTHNHHRSQQQQSRDPIIVATSTATSNNHHKDEHVATTSSSSSSSSSSSILLEHSSLILNIRKVDLVQWPPTNPQHVQIILRAAADGLLNLHQVAAAAQSKSWKSSSLLSSSPLLNATTLQRLLWQQKTCATSTTKNSSRTPLYYQLAKQLLAEYASDDPTKSNHHHHGPHNASTTTSTFGILQDKSRGVPVLPPAPVYWRHVPQVATLEKQQIQQQQRKHSPPEQEEDSTNYRVWPESSSNNHNKEALVTFTGCVQNRRRFDQNITVLELATVAVNSEDKGKDKNNHPTSNNNTINQLLSSPSRVTCVLHPHLVESAKALAHLFAPESTVQLQGLFSYHTDPKNPASQDTSTTTAKEFVWITSIRLVRSCWRPKVIEYLLELTEQGIVDMSETAGALNITESALNKIMTATSATTGSSRRQSKTVRQWHAAELSRTLQTAATRVASLAPEVIRVLDDFAAVRNRFPLQAVHSASSFSQDQDGDNDFDDRQRKCDAIRDGSRWKRKKEPQLQWMAEQVETVLRSHQHYGRRKLRILDIGGGQGYLANHLASSFTSGTEKNNIEITVVDIEARAVQNGAMRSKRLQLPVQYQVADASTFLEGQTQRNEVEQEGIHHASRGQPQLFDVVVALHACGALTDVALGIAVAQRAGFVICPCCFRSNPHLRVVAPPSKYVGKNTASRESSSAIGYCTVEEYLNVDPRKYNALKLMAEVQGDRELASSAIHSICALRAAAALQHGRVPDEHDDLVAIKTFPIAFSTRNFCLVGKV